MGGLLLCAEWTCNSEEIVEVLVSIFSFDLCSFHQLSEWFHEALRISISLGPVWGDCVPFNAKNVYVSFIFASVKRRSIIYCYFLWYTVSCKTLVQFRYAHSCLSRIDDFDLWKL